MQYMSKIIKAITKEAAGSEKEKELLGKMDNVRARLQEISNNDDNVLNLSQEFGEIFNEYNKKYK